MTKEIFTKSYISSHKEIAEGSFLIGFKRDFEFKAGQIIGIAIEENGPRRLYSICSGEKDSDILILYKRVEKGVLTPQLSDLQIGDPIWITEPRGTFISDDHPHTWIATGTGIAPFYSMLRSGKTKDVILLHGERDEKMFYFQKEFKELLGDNYIRCSSTETSENFYTGRVSYYMLDIKVLDTKRKYYLCGSAEMVVEVRDILISRGVSFEDIISEIYF